MSWGASAPADPEVRYVLQEATNAAFTLNTRELTVTGLSVRITGKAAGTYFYRVKATQEGKADSLWKARATGCVVP